MNNYSNTKLILRRMLRNPFFMIGASVAVILLILSIFAPGIITHDPLKVNMYTRFTAPQWLSGAADGYILGTDANGRDIFARLLIGSRNSFFIAFMVTGISLVVGLALGIMAGFYGGIVDSVIMRTCDVFMSIPTLVIAISIVVVLGDSKYVLIGVLALSGWVSYCRTIRSSVSVIRNREFVMASKVLGAGDLRIMLTQVLPNVVTPALILISQMFGTMILVEASISYLGLGIRAPVPSWGNMIADGRQYLSTAPWLVVSPGVALMLTVLAFNFLGDGLRDVLDPKRH